MVVAGSTCLVRDKIVGTTRTGLGKIQRGRDETGLHCQELTGGLQDTGGPHAMAKERLAEVKSKFPKASVTGLEDVRAFYLLADEPAKYHEYAHSTVGPRGIDRKTALKKIAKPLKELSREWQLFHKLVS